MIRGIVSSQLDAIVGVEVRGRSQSRFLHAVVDTGFNGHLSLGLKVIHELQMTAIGARVGELADGTKTVLEAFTATALWEGKQRKITVVESDGECLLGMAMLKNSRLTIDVIADGQVVIEPLTD